MSSLSDRMRELAPVLEEADARFLAEYPHLREQLKGGWTAGGLLTYADAWEGEEVASA